ncbi:hypothetical protein PT2222_90027 [Paraburkholderia tropica]
MGWGIHCPARFGCGIDAPGMPVMDCSAARFCALMQPGRQPRARMHTAASRAAVFAVHLMRGCRADSGSALLRLAERPLARQRLFEPERADHRLHVGDLAVTHPFEQFGQRGREGFEEFAFVELRLARREATREIDVDELGRVRNDRVNLRQINVFARRVAGLFLQFADRACERAFLRIELACRKLGHHARQRIAILALHQHAPVVEQRNHHDRAGMLHVFARGVLAVRQRDRIAFEREKFARVERRAFDARLGERRVVFLIFSSHVETSERRVIGKARESREKLTTRASCGTRRAHHA